MSFTAKIDKGWNAYALTHPKDGTGLPVKISVKDVNGLVPSGKGWRPNKPPKASIDFEDNPTEEHDGTITWSRKFKVVSKPPTGGFGLRGQIRVQLCDAGQCLPPKQVSFALGDLRQETEAPKGSNQIDETAFPGGSDEGASGSLAWFLFAAFLGGLILNVMPCVLPVIAIKGMSFVQQAGESRRRILALNGAYSAGVMSVFILLATLAIVLKLGWGGLFQKPEFNLVMACIIFAMGLSLLGVFEIPLPGFVGSAAGGHQKEGLGGAFMTGIFATLLATPCTGPFLGTTLAWSVKQPVAVTYLIWTLMGFGMASPYLVLGLFPQLTRFLPKPGNWMVRMKEFAGFVLMGTVVFFTTILTSQYVLPLLIMLVGIALGLWMIGNLYVINSPIRKKTTVRITALLLTAGICGFGYSMTIKSQHELPWQEFSTAKLEESLNDNKTVLVDFTADYCINCKVNEKLALNTAETLAFVKKHNIVAMVADYSGESEEIKSWLDKFHTDGVPLTVIFPANQPDKPIVLRALYSQSSLLAGLKKAVNAKQKGGEKSPKKTPKPKEPVIAAAGEVKLPWKKFDGKTLRALLSAQKTVLVDFTADWCINCKVNEKVALNTKKTLGFVQKHGIVPLIADYTHESPEIKRWLERFKTDAVPLTVIFPANRPDQPIVLRARFSQEKLLQKLKEAVRIPKSAVTLSPRIP
ncbi:MAG: thioredoxin family protein [Planctomycetes bacterium]|nr:thioredoxin family protein [Planctomycetota bacterium]